MENQFANFCVIGSIEDPKQKLPQPTIIPTINDMIDLDFSKKAGYPIKLMKTIQKLLENRK